MKFISWNVNGIRAALKKDFKSYMEESDADFVCVQETKAWEEQVDPLPFGRLHRYWSSAEKKGYSGTLILAKEEAESVTLGVGQEELDHEGRVVSLEYSDFFLVNVYTPNIQPELKRKAFRSAWDTAFLVHINMLEKKKPVIFCGDLNVSHKEIDLARPGPNRGKPGFSAIERSGFDNIIEAGFVDTFRHFDPSPGNYTWWSFRAGARRRNVGWRIDYFGASPNIIDRVSSSIIMPEVTGSDHCPVVLELKD